MNIFYSKAFLRFFYCIFILNTFIKKTFRFIFVMPVLKVIEFNKFLKSVYLYYKFNNIVSNEFELYLKNSNLEKFIKDYEVLDIMKTFVTNNPSSKSNIYNKYSVSYNGSDRREFLFKMNIELFEATIELTEGRYYFDFKINKTQVVNSTKKLCKNRGVSRMFLEN